MKETWRFGGFSRIFRFALHYLLFALRYFVALALMFPLFLITGDSRPAQILAALAMASVGFALLAGTVAAQVRSKDR